MTKKIRPISVDNWPSISTNCLGFAIGDTTDVVESESKYNLDHHYPIEEAFVRKLSELGYSTENLRIRKVESAKPNEYIFKVYGFKKSYYTFMGFRFECFDFHVVRGEPIEIGKDGKPKNRIFVGKGGWKDAPCIIEYDDWPEFEDEFGTHFVLFALSVSSEEE